MEKANRIVLKELVERHKDSRLLAMTLRDQRHAQLIEGLDEGAPAPAKPNHKDNDILDALYAEMRDNPDAHPTCVAKYDEMAKQYMRNNNET